MLQEIASIERDVDSNKHRKTPFLPKYIDWASASSDVAPLEGTDKVDDAENYFLDFITDAGRTSF